MYNHVHAYKNETMLNQDSSKSIHVYIITMFIQHF